MSVQLNKHLGYNTKYANAKLPYMYVSNMQVFVTFQGCQIGFFMRPEI